MCEWQFYHVSKLANSMSSSMQLHSSPFKYYHANTKWTGGKEKSKNQEVMHLDKHKNEQQHFNN